MTDHGWTLDQLAELVGAALSVDYDGQASGRVRDLPDRRAIRYYTTIGLVDRPAAMRGRTALYTRRHLLQLVAIKRLQAAGMSLAEVQARLAGATDAQLEREARVPASLPVEAAAAAAGERAVPARMARPRVPAAPPRAAPRAASARPAFWKRAAAAPTAPMVPTSAARAVREPEPASTKSAPDEVASEPEPAQSPAAPDEVASLQGLRLGPGVTLLLDRERPLDAGDVEAIRAAAAPLLEVLRRGREQS
jgi:DNA-binding transcriptional MerR regulator